MAADLIVYAIIAAGLVLWLRGLLGTRTGSERERPNPFTSHPDAQQQQQKPGAAQPGRALPAPPVNGLTENGEPDLRSRLGRNMGIASAEAERGLLEIARASKGFDLGLFMAGAQEAFPMIVEAFAAGDRRTLKDLLSPEVYASFDKVIAEREARGETATMEIHAVRRAEITAAHIAGKTAFITVRFTADETGVVRDADGKLLSGNPDRVSETIDLWTFGRELRARDPAWLVYETREEVQDAVHVPDAENGSGNAG
jgi:predicted lipid-binding transport protein (Tim44 family)